MSIFKKLTILFIISFVLMTVIGLWIDNINLKRVDNFAKEKYLKVIDDIFKNIENKNYLDSLILKNSLEKVNFLDENNLETIYSQNSAFKIVLSLKLSSSNALKIYDSSKYFIFRYFCTFNNVFIYN